MLILLDRRVGGLGLRKIATDAAYMLLGCGVMALACWGVQRVPAFPHGHGTIASMEELTLLMVIGGAAYVGTCELLGLKLIPRG